MIFLPDPLVDDFGGEGNVRPAERILSDRGIEEAIRQGLIKITPELDPNDGRRIQPATLDVKTGGITGLRNLSSGRDCFFPDIPLSLPEKCIAGLELTENIDPYGYRAENGHPFLGLSADGRSSLLRFGCFTTLTGAVTHGFGDNAEINMANFSPNTIFFDPAERVAQLFFRVAPFVDTYGQTFFVGDKPRYTEKGDRIRALDMGVEVIDPVMPHILQSEGFMNISRPRGKKFEVDNRGRILFHASRESYRMKKVEGGIHFSRRKEYGDDVLLERIDISHGYRIKPFEHIVCFTEEKFDLSSHVGVRGWDNLSKTDARGRLLPHMRNMGVGRRTPIDNFLLNMEMFPVTCSWVDPGYKGSFTRFPKFIGQVIRPGDVIGYGQVFFFPKGVKRPYGSKDLGSQYQGQGKLQFAAK